MQMTPLLWLKVKKTKEPLDEIERGELNAGIKLKIQKKMKIMASGPIISWKIDGKTMETVTDFTFLGSKMQMVTAAMKLKDTCSLEEKL